MKYLLIFSLLFSVQALAIEPNQMVVVVNDEQTQRLEGVGAVTRYFNRKHGSFEIHSLDGVANFENELSKGLSSDSEKAKKQAKEMYEKMGKAAMTKLILKAYKAKMLTLNYQLEKYPAIIFDDKYVVYGEFNLNTALNRYIRHQEKQ